MEIKNIEEFFLNSLLKISMTGVILVLMSDVVMNPEDVSSIYIDIAIMAACTTGYLIRRRSPAAAVVITTSIVLLAMFYQCLFIPENTTTSFSIILVAGFIISVMLRGTLLWAMHIATLVIINVIFSVQYLNPTLYKAHKPNEIVTIAITYSVVYAILTYAAAVLKGGYNKMHLSLIEANSQLSAKANEIESQNEELRQTQNNLSALNGDLERIVNERTAKIQEQNEILMKYSYANAHQLRGPVARILGLIAVRELDPGRDDFYFSTVKLQAEEIDHVVKQINSELGTV